LGAILRLISRDVGQNNGLSRLAVPITPPLIFGASTKLQFKSLAKSDELELLFRFLSNS
jgi:hypothetical protein